MKNLISILLLFLSTTLFSQSKIQIPFKKGKLWGYADTSGKVTITPIYDTVYFFDRDMARVRKNKLEGAINSAGQLLIPTIYSSCVLLEYTEIINDMTVVKQHFTVKKEGKLGVVDKSNKVKIPIVYDEINWETDDYSIVRKGRLYGAIKRENGNYRLIVPLEYTSVEFNWVEDYFTCKKMDATVFRDVSGKVIVDMPEMDMSSDATSVGAMFDDVKSGYGHVLFEENGKYGVKQNGYNSTPKIILEPIYEEIANKDKLWFNENFVVKLNGKWGVVDKKGAVLLPLEYEGVNYDLSTTYGFISREYVKQFWVQLNGKWGMIGAQDMNSLDFNVILPLEYDNAIHFGRDFLLVTKENKTTVYNLVKRKLVTTKTYKSISGDFVYSHSSLILFWVTNEKGDKFLLGENGVEFYASN